MKKIEKPKLIFIGVAVVVVAVILGIAFAGHHKQANKAVSGQDAKGEFVHLTDAPEGFTPIRTAEDLQNMGSDGQYILLNDLDLSGSTWTPIRDKFTGTLDGNGYVVKGLTVSGDNNGGLFSTLAGANVQNLSLDAFTVDADESAGALAGMILSAESETIITNCHALSGTVHASNAGGLVGTVSTNEVSFTYCSAKGTVNGTNAGGLCGTVQIKENDTVTIKDCLFDAAISTEVTGGVVGKAQTAGKLQMTNVFALSNTLTGESIGALVGFIDGKNTASTNLDNCYYTVSGEQAFNKNNGKDNRVDSTSHYVPHLEILMESLPEGYDFNNVWYVNTEIQQPALRANPGTAKA